MPYTGKQERFFQAVAHGMKPTKTDSDLTPEKAKELLGHENKKVKARQRGMDRALSKL